jgi:hypothetical protein
MGKHSQKVHRAGMLRLPGQNLPVKLFCIAVLPRLMLPQRLIEELLDRGLSHIADRQYPVRLTA